MDFVTYRALIILCAWLQFSLALFVLFWFGLTAIQSVRQTGWTQTNRLMVGVVLVALAVVANTLMWLPAHYYRGAGLHIMAIDYTHRWLPLVYISAWLSVVGYLMHVVTAMSHSRNRSLVILILSSLVLMGVGIWGWLGGFSYNYI